MSRAPYVGLRLSSFFGRQSGSDANPICEATQKLSLLHSPPPRGAKTSGTPSPTPPSPPPPPPFLRQWRWLRRLRERALEGGERPIRGLDSLHAFSDPWIYVCCRCDVIRGSYDVTEISVATEHLSRNFGDCVRCASAMV